MNTGPELLQELKDVINIPAISEGNEDPLMYRFLTKAQEHWMGKLAQLVPDVTNIMSEPMTTTDGKTYSTSNDILSNLDVFERNYHSKLNPGTYEDYELDYAQTGPRTISINGKNPSRFAYGLEARYVPKPPAITAEQGPVLQPAHARMLIVYHAAVLWSLRGGNYNPAPYREMEQELAWGVSDGTGGLIGQLKQRSGRVGFVNDQDQPWWHSPDLSIF